MITKQMIRWIETLIAEDRLVKFYQCKQWRSLRLVALELANYECEECKRKGKYSRAQNVHHLQEVKHRPDLALTLENLECVCLPCHNLIHDKRLRKDTRKPYVNEERW